jgi:hypothetical protein
MSRSPLEAKAPKVTKRAQVAAQQSAPHFGAGMTGPFLAPGFLAGPPGPQEVDAGGGELRVSGAASRAVTAGPADQFADPLGDSIFDGHAYYL